MNRIKKNDVVYVTAGKSKGHIGKVLNVSANSVLVEGANIIKKHVKPNPNINQPGGIIPSEKPLHISNVALYDPVSKKPSKVGFRFVESNDGKMKKVRYFKASNELVDAV